MQRPSSPVSKACVRNTGVCRDAAARDTGKEVGGASSWRVLWATVNLWFILRMFIS